MNSTLTTRRKSCDLAWRDVMDYTHWLEGFGCIITTDARGLRAKTVGLTRDQKDFGVVLLDRYRSEAKAYYQERKNKRGKKHGTSRGERALPGMVCGRDDPLLPIRYTVHGDPYAIAMGDGKRPPNGPVQGGNSRIRRRRNHKGGEQ